MRLEPESHTANTLGVILPDLHGDFFSELLRGIDRVSRARGYHLLVSSFHSDRAELEAALRASRGRVDGLILLTPDASTATERADLPDTMPVIVLGAPVSRTALDSIHVDNLPGAFAMARHLLRVGHRRIAFVRGPADNYEARERLRGFREGLQTAGAEWSEDLEVPGAFTEDSGYEAARILLSQRRRPDAVFAANEAEKSATIKLVHVQPYGAFGRVMLAGEESNIDSAMEAAVRAIERRFQNLKMRR